MLNKAVLGSRWSVLSTAIAAVTKHAAGSGTFEPSPSFTIYYMNQEC